MTKKQCLKLKKEREAPADTDAGQLASALRVSLVYAFSLGLISEGTAEILERYQQTTFEF
jgi:hypothetical protein